MYITCHDYNNFLTISKFNGLISFPFAKNISLTNHSYKATICLAFIFFLKQTIENNMAQALLECLFCSAAPTNQTRSETKQNKYI